MKQASTGVAKAKSTAAKAQSAAAKTQSTVSKAQSTAAKAQSAITAATKVANDVKALTSAPLQWKVIVGPTIPPVQELFDLKILDKAKGKIEGKIREQGHKLVSQPLQKAKAIASNSIEKAEPESSACSACGVPAREGTLFCIKCGTPLKDGIQQPSRVEKPCCKKCAAPLKSDASFCMKCGTRC